MNLDMTDYARVEPRLAEVLTQYRESPKLLWMLRTYLRQVEIVEQAIWTMPEAFNLDTAVGDQLTLLGKRLGFPRDHCVCDIQPVFGFECPDGSGQPVLGFCDGADWDDCVDFGISTAYINDDELYRKFLQVRRYQMMGLYDRQSLLEAVEILWGPTATIMDAGHGRVVLAPGRDLTDVELGLLQVYPRVLPVGLGIAVRFHFGALNVFGFGDGWGGFCEGSAPTGLPLLTEADVNIQAENNANVEHDDVGVGADWMCEIDVRPYDC